MHAEVLAINNASEWHGIEDLHEQIVSFNVVPVNGFFPKGEVFSHIPALMIPSEQHHALLEIQLYTQQQQHHFDSVDPSVHIISQE